MLRSGGWSPQEGDELSSKRSRRAPCPIDPMRIQPAASTPQPFSRTCRCQPPISDEQLQASEKQTSIAFKPRTAAQTDQDKLLLHQHKTGILAGSHKIHKVVFTRNKEAMCLHTCVQQAVRPVTSPGKIRLQEGSLRVITTGVSRWLRL